MSYPAEQQRIVDRLGPSWCFEHGQAMPCDQCKTVSAEHPFIGRCFDCKREYATEGEHDADSCSCYEGCRIRKTGLYKYP